MLTNPEQTVVPANFLDWLLSLIFTASSKPIVHDHTQKTDGIDYVFEVTANATQVHVTGYGKGIKHGDYLVLTQGRYQIEEIDYYANPSCLWVASLVKAPQQKNV